MLRARVDQELVGIKKWYQEVAEIYVVHGEPFRLLLFSQKVVLVRRVFSLTILE